MRARETIELAALVVTHGRPLVANRSPLSASGLNEYWLASKCRADRWVRSLRRSQRDLESRPREAVWPRTWSVLSEIMAADVLTRVWTAVVVASDRGRGSDEGETVVRNILAGQAEARNRGLRLILQASREGQASHPILSAEALENYRRRTERWTDLLVAYLVVEHDVSEFACQPDRARDFAEDIGREERNSGRRGWELTIRSLHNAFASLPDPPVPNTDLNARIADSILSCFGTEMFDSIGVLQSLWMARLEHRADDATGMIEQLLQGP